MLACVAYTSLMITLMLSVATHNNVVDWFNESM